MRRVLLPLVASCALFGCGVPNRAIRAEYADYNQTIHLNQSQQMLLNLVRLKYRELPLFLKVGALSVSYSFEVQGGADFGKSASTQHYGVAVGATYASRPTITYTPLEGDTFVKQVLSEIDTGAFILLFRSGWRIELLAHVMVERIGPALNSRSDPSYPRFLRIVERLQAAQDADKMRFDQEEDDTMTLVLTTDFLDILSDERVAEERELRYPVNSVQLRSFLDVLYFLGKNTDVPEEHLNQVKASTPNDWIRIRSSPNRPDDAQVSVRYNGYWFSIANSDIDSKDAFALITLIYQMQAGDIPTVQPILTLPLAQP